MDSDISGSTVNGERVIECRKLPEPEHCEEFFAMLGEAEVREIAIIT